MSLDAAPSSAPRVARWEGLCLESAANAGGWRSVHVVVDEALLYLHDRPGRRYKVRWDFASWEFKVGPGMFDFFPAGAYDVVGAGPDPIEAKVVRIPPAFQRALQDERGGNELAVPRFQFADARLSALMHLLARCVDRQTALPSADAVLVSVALVDRLCDVVGGAPGRGSHFSPLMKRVLAEYIDDHVGEPLNAVAMGALVGLAKSRFGETFKGSFGLPLHTYMLARKVEVAREKLVDADVNVGTLAHDLGFSSHSHFTTHFRKVTGQTPTQFRDAFMDTRRR